VLPTHIADNLSDNNVFIGDENHTRSGLGWINMFMATLEEWSNRTQQDKHSMRIDIPIRIDFKLSINDKAIPNLDWYQALRHDFKPIVFNPELRKLTIGVTDLRAGPTLPIQPLQVSKQR
jgi:hypothetical protein